MKNQDIANKRFGRLTAIKKVGVNKDYRAIWLCKCECGKEKNILARCLLRGTTKSCGCLQKENASNYHNKINNLLNKKFGRLLVISRASNPPKRKKLERFWLCKCECGKDTVVSTSSLNSGWTRSCGCLWMESINGIHYTERNPELDMFRVVHANLNRLKCKVTITLKDLKEQWDKQKGICVYSGIPLILPEWHAPRRHPQIASLDRIDSAKDYVPNNIQFVSIIANYAKNEMAHEEMLYFCRSIAKFWRDRC